jgi:hypothetical protein
MAKKRKFHQVKGYQRKDGTRVRPHMRCMPNRH